MNDLFTAAEQVQALCTERGWDFCFIGGLAVQRWGEPRLTRDVDLTLLTGFGNEDRYVEQLLERFTSRVDDTVAFARRARVVLLRGNGDVPIDVALGGLPFEQRAVQRSSLWPVPDAEPLRTCSAEDLLVQKVFAGRDRDWADVAGIVARQAPGLDTDIVVDELAPLLELKEDTEALNRLRSMLG